ncbi:unnamed protein product [Commensalibacter communis]|nr:unnamed protein product [Commensalibacter communis]CAI3930487.1 unnamed protein product [Commensalibacter communis]
MKFQFSLIPIFFFMFSIHAWSIPKKPEYHNGTFIYKIYYEEQNSWMGDTVIVKIHNDRIKIYAKKVNISGIKNGELMEDGVIRQHKSGVWIISSPNSPQDVNLDHIEACQGDAPATIDFKKKIYWMC